MKKPMPQYSPNHKVVTDSPHTYSEGGSCYADGGDIPDIKGGGVRGMADDYGTAIKQTFHDMTTSKSGKSPLAAPDSTSPGAGKGGAERTAATLDLADKMS